MLLPERLICFDSEILAGKPIVRGSRLAAEFIIELLAAGMTESDILENYTEAFQHEDILACLTYASRLAYEWKAFPLSA